MALYMYQFAYTADSWAAQVKKPENRIENVGRAMCEAAGGKFIGGWLCFGEYDGVFDRRCAEHGEHGGDRPGHRRGRRRQDEQDDGADDRSPRRRGFAESGRGRKNLPTGQIAAAGAEQTGAPRLVARAPLRLWSTPFSRPGEGSGMRVQAGKVLPRRLEQAGSAPAARRERNRLDSKPSSCPFPKGREGTRLDASSDIFERAALLHRLSHGGQRRSDKLEPREARVKPVGGEVRGGGFLFDHPAGFIFAVRQGVSEQSSARLTSLQQIIAAAAAAPMANMQITWMENSAKRTLTTALVWRSAT